MTIFLIILATPAGVAGAQTSAEVKTNELIQAKTQVKISQLAKERKEVMKELIRNDPEQALRIALSDKVKKQLPKSAQRDIEEEAEIEGSLIVSHTDDFERNVAEYEYTLSTADNKTFSLHFADKDTQIRPAKKVKVKGISLGGEMAVQSSVELIPLESSTAEAAVLAPPKKVLVLLINFTDNTIQPWTIDQVKSAIFGTSNSVNSYYIEQSFDQLSVGGKVNSDGDVYGWYTIPYASSVCKTVQSPSNLTLSDAANAAAQAVGVDTTGYDNYMYVFPKSSSCAWAGYANIPPNPPHSFINGWGTNVFVISHELGHNFSTHHASGYNCTDVAGARVSLSGNCTISEYGDPFDVMGSGGFSAPFVPNHTNNYHKGEIGWWQDLNTFIATSSGTFTLSPIEQTTSGITALLIPRTYDILGGVDKYYYLEYRQPFGTDNFLPSDPVVNGTTIRIARPYGAVIDKSWLIDTTPTTTSFSDSSLLAGQVFTDLAKGISFTTTGVSTASAEVQVDFIPPVCVRAKPTVSISPSGQWGFAGQPLTYSVRIINNDSTPACSASVFDITPTFPSSDWSQSPNPASVNLSPGNYQNVSVTVTPSSAVLPGFYPFTLTAANSADPQYNSSKAANYNVYPPDTTSPVTSITKPLDNAYVKGTVAIKASASDNASVTKVEFYVDGVLLATDTTASYSASWNVNGLPNGSVHQLYTKAYDYSGNIGTSAPVNVTIDKTQPTVAITNPLNNANVAVNTTVTITADATDNFAMSKVSFFINNTKICTDIDPPYSCDWAVPITPSIIYTIKATASDQAGNSKSASISVISQ